MRDSVLLIDLENVCLRLRALRGRCFDVSEAIRLAGGWPRLAAVRAYADTRDVFDSTRFHLEQNGVELVDIPCRRCNGSVIKNSVDVAMSFAIWKMVERSSIQRIIVATGDRDFLQAVVHAHGEGREVGVVAVDGSLSTELRFVVGDENVSYLQGGAPIRTKPHTLGVRLAAA